MDAVTSVSTLSLSGDGDADAVKKVAKVGSREYLKTIDVVALLNAFT
jgi:hypothetical protein